MLTLDEIRERLSDRNVMEVVRRTGLNKNTVYKFRSTAAHNPHYDTVKLLSDYLQGQLDGAHG